MSLFDTLPSTRYTKAQSNTILQKSIVRNKYVPINKTTTSKKSVSNYRDMLSLQSSLSDVIAKEVLIIREEDQLREYVEAIIANDIFAIDTETSGLDTMVCSIAGICLYTPGNKKAYIPIGHISAVTHVLVKSQLSMEVVTSYMNTLSSIKCIMFNANYDSRIMSHIFGIQMNIYMDVFIASKLVVMGKDLPGDLKSVYARDTGGNELGKYKELFGGLDFRYVPLELASLYGATDAFMTWELFDKVYKGIFDTDKYTTLKPVYELEMSMIPVIISMEDYGIRLDVGVAEDLLVLYKEKEKATLECVMGIIDEHKEAIDNYRRFSGASCKLQEPINVKSPTQLAVLLYDILGLESKTRTTNEATLSDLKHPLAKKVLEFRAIEKFISTYIEKLPKLVNDKTKKIHCSFNSLGARTGRFSSSDPNMQNIPKDDNVRNMFTADEGYILISLDYSSQEPRLAAVISKDKLMLDAFNKKLDYYAYLGKDVFNTTYEECLATKNGVYYKEGDKRRNVCKKIFLGICYGMTVFGISDALSIPVDEAQELIDIVLDVCPGLKQLQISSISFARETGYVQTLWGRRRYLDGMLLPKYAYKYREGLSINFDPLDWSNYDYDNVVPSTIIHKYDDLMDKAKYKNQKLEILKKATEEGLSIVDNSSAISACIRQCVNSEVQGSAADMTKLGMLNVHNCLELKDLGYELLLPIHDEIIGQCPIENVNAVTVLLRQCMLQPVSMFEVPFEVDFHVSTSWSGPNVYNSDTNLVEL